MDIATNFLDRQLLPGREEILNAFHSCIYVHDYKFTVCRYMAIVCDKRILLTHSVNIYVSPTSLGSNPDSKPDSMALSSRSSGFSALRRSACSASSGLSDPRRALSLVKKYRTCPSHYRRQSGRRGACRAQVLARAPARAAAGRRRGERAGLEGRRCMCSWR